MLLLLLMVVVVVAAAVFSLSLSLAGTTAHKKMGSLSVDGAAVIRE